MCEKFSRARTLTHWKSNEKRKRKRALYNSSPETVLAALERALAEGHDCWLAVTLMYRRVMPWATDKDIQGAQAEIIRSARQWAKRKGHDPVITWAIEKVQGQGTHGHLLISMPAHLQADFRHYFAMSLRTRFACDVLPPKFPHWDGWHGGKVSTEKAFWGRAFYQLKGAAACESVGVRRGVGLLPVECKRIGVSGVRLR